MSTHRHDLTSLVEKLRQEQEFSLFYKTQIRQTVQNINQCCDGVFQSLWLAQCLACGLEKVKVHHTQCIDWTWALEQVGYVEFTDAAKILQSSLLIENYDKFLSALLNGPTLLARVLAWAESEGRDSAALIGDLMSVVYGHCVFQHDHALFLGLLKELLGHLVSSADSPKDLFSGVEPIFSRVLTEYCNQLTDLQTFLVEAFQMPLTEIFLCEEHLEFDVTKAGTRFQSSTENANGRLLDGSAFLFGEDLDSSCKRLAELAMQFVDNIHRLTNQFPTSLKWILGTLKFLVQTKWPDVSAAELRRPVSSVLFGPVLGSTIVNPDSHGVCDMGVVVSPVVRYNLSQIASVLQGCAWVMERQGGKFPMQKVIKKMNTKSYCDLLDSLDGGCGREPPHLPSSLPGLKRSVYLTSQTQLNNLVGVVCEVASDLSRRDDPTPEDVRHGLSDLTSQLPLPVKQMAARAPYSPHVPRSRSPVKPASLRSETMDVSKARTSKRVSIDVGKLPTKANKKRSSSTSNLNHIVTGSSTGARMATRSISPNQMLHTHSDVFLQSPPGGQNVPGNFHVPSEVLILPISKENAAIDVSHEPSTAALWDFALLSQDEFMQQHHTSSKQVTSPPTEQPHPITPLHPHTPTSPDLHSPSTSQPLSSSLPPDSTPTEPHPHSPLVPIPICPAPVPEIPNGPTTAPGMESGQVNHGFQNGLETCSSSTGSPVRMRWRDGSGGSGTRTGTSRLTSGGSDSSLSACMSSREPSSSPQTIPKKRSFTVTSIEKGKFALSVELSPLRHCVHPNPPPLSPPPHSPPVPIITTTPTPTSLPHSPPPIFSPPPLTNHVTPTPTTPIMDSSDSQLIPNGAHCTDSPNTAHLVPLQLSDGENAHDHLPIPNRELSPSNPDLSASDLDRPSSDGQSEPPSQIGSSIENLMDDQPDTQRGGGKGSKRKWFKRRKKESKDKRKIKMQMSLQEETSKADLVTKQRSHSDFNILDGPDHDDLKKLSASHEELETSSQFEEDLENSPRAVYKRRRSYTIIAAPIMEKYTALVREKKKQMEAAPIIEKKLESLKRTASLRVKEMDPQTFQHSLFCTQLEFKLRAALQNIHTPLTSSSVYQQLRLEEESKCDSKYQLTTLLQGALQRSKWFHDDMETALLTETLRMVNQLPNTLVGVALESAHKEQGKRLAYTNYLVQSHMKFLDVQLQVRAMQSTVDRRQEVLKDQFVQFVVRQFLDAQADQLVVLRREMASLSLADERCSLMTERLQAFTEALLEDQTWRYWPREGMETVSNYVEDELFSLLYPYVFQPNMELDRQKDEIFSSHLSTLSKGLTPNHRSLQISPIYHSGCPWLTAQKHLKAMSLFKSPRGKVHCVAECCRVLIRLLQYAKVGSPPGADDLFPVLVYVLIKANPPGLLSTTQYIKNFLEDQLKGEENYWWVQFSTAVEFTKTLE